MIDQGDNRESWSEWAQITYLVDYTYENVTNAMNDSHYTLLQNDPIWFIDSSNKWEIQTSLQALSNSSTKSYIKSFMLCVEFTTHFETKAWELFMTYWNKKQQLIMSLIYLLKYQKIDTKLYNLLIWIVNSSTTNEALSARNTMIRIGIVWAEETLDDPILVQFLTKAAYAEHGLQKIA